MIPTPDGTRRLAQRSGECEVPTAYLVDGADTGSAKPAVGSGEHPAPSLALGWTSANEAVIHLEASSCGSSDGVPGLYAVHEGRMRLIARTDGMSRTQMWQPPRR